MAIIISIKPQFSHLIFSGKEKYNGGKYYELRKDSIRFDVDKLIVVYESNPTKAIVGFFEIDKIVRESPQRIWELLKNELGISEINFFKYYQDKSSGCAIKIKDPKLFKNKIPLMELRETYGSWYPPQNFRYLREIEREILKRETI